MIEENEYEGHHPRPTLREATPRLNPYGFCPECGQPGTMRARDTIGTTWCANQHQWIPNPPAVAALLNELSAARSVISELVAFAKSRDWSSHAPLTAWVIESVDERDALRTRARELETALKEATTPDLCGESECGGGIYFAEVDYDGLSEDILQYEPLEVWANRSLGQWWAARIPTEWSDEGDVTSESVRLYPTRKEADDALFTAWSTHTDPAVAASREATNG